jgi:hypothetical protein
MLTYQLVASLTCATFTVGRSPIFVKIPYMLPRMARDTVVFPADVGEPFWFGYHLTIPCPQTFIDAAIRVITVVSYVDYA